MKFHLFKKGLVFFALLFTWNAYAQDVIKVACVGNSITEGSAIEEGKRYPQQLQELMGPGYEVRNFGVSGRTLLKKGDYPYWNEPQFEEVQEWNPDIVVIKLGTNDSKPQNWKFKEDFVKDYVEFVNTFKKLPSNPKIYLAYPIPVFEENWGITESIVKNEILPAVKKIGKKTNTEVIDLYTPFVGKSQLTYDGIHPNAEGADFLATEVYKEIISKEKQEKKAKK